MILRGGANAVPGIGPLLNIGLTGAQLSGAVSSDPVADMVSGLSGGTDGQTPGGGAGNPQAAGSTIQAAELSFPRPAPHMATMLHSFREESSALGMRTNIIVQSHAASTNQGEKNDLLHITVFPHKDIDRAHACSYFTVTDDTAVDSPGALIAVAIAYARVIGKDVRAAACTMLGDPSIVPGEAIQVIGSPMHQGYTDPALINADRAKFYEMAQAYEDMFSRMPAILLADVTTLAPGESPDGGGGWFGGLFGGGGDDPDLQRKQGDVVPLPVGDNGKDGEPVTLEVQQSVSENEEVMLVAAQERQELLRNTVRFNPEPPTMWRVEGVVDRFNDGTEGYYTELSLLSCF